MYQNTENVLVINYCLIYYSSAPDSASGTQAPKPSVEEEWLALDGPIARCVTAVVIGAGQRGQNYSAFALDFPSRMKIVAVAEKLAHRQG